MPSEREILSRLEASNAQEFIDLLSHPDRDEERVLRAYFGETRFRELQDLALRASTRAATVKGNVVVLHGIMGSELTYHESTKDNSLIWVSLWRLLWGGFGKLGCDADGASLLNVTATGILKSYYGKQILALAGHWNVRAFWYDWRVDIDASANALAKQIDLWFGTDTPVHLVAHSMGGLVARRFISTNPKRWQTMWDSAGSGKLGGRLVMLGTPNFGSFAIPLLYVGLNSLMNKMALVDVQNKSKDLLEAAKTFVGTYQMLPSLDKMPEMADLYKPGTYGDLNPLQARFDAAKRLQNSIKDVIDKNRMVYVAGYNQPTVDGIQDWKNLRSLKSYQFTRRGDGTVPHTLGLLESVPTFFVDEEHGKLPDNSKVIAAVDEILQTGTTSSLPVSIPNEIRGIETQADREDAKAAAMARCKAEEQTFESLTATFKVRGASRTVPEVFSREERLMADTLLAEFVGTTASMEFAKAAVAAGATVSGFEGSGGAAPTVVRPIIPGGAENPAQVVPGITIRIEAGSIADAGQASQSPRIVPRPIDAIAVGHYSDVRPVSAERALGRAISVSLPVADGSDLITQFAERRIIRGGLAQPFFLPDPRNDGRLIVIAGMGEPGQFSIPELTLLVREVCWSLGRLGKKHLATVLIGAGAGNIEVGDAVEAWLRGIRRALNEAVQPDSSQLEVITFFETSASRIASIQNALKRSANAMASTLHIETQLITDDELAAYAEKPSPPSDPQGADVDGVATRLMVEMIDGTYRFAAMTQNASVPERRVSINSLLVTQANDALVEAVTETEQAEYGEYLQRLLVPSDMRGHLTTDAPLVITSDTTTAQIHWEMLTQPNLDVADPSSIPTEERFLGLCRGLTRQLKTGFSSTQSSSGAARGLRVLIVADPAADARLPGALEEARAVQELFEAYGKQSRSRYPLEMLKVLIGPAQATCTAVLKELMLRSYDVLHFAGHCSYNKDNPAASGWIFSLKDNLILSAAELNRLDRVPRFVFSNACESGVLPDRAELRSALLAPSFAEAFFARGVANFICTAWPVNDLAARSFAVALYSSLLGMFVSPEPMHKALRNARLEIHRTGGGARSWGAYQHYGNPYFKLVR